MGVLESPIEDWMALLAPAPAELVRRSLTGPARICGAAGPGRTGVGPYRHSFASRSPRYSTYPID